MGVSYTLSKEYLNCTTTLVVIVEIIITMWSQSNTINAIFTRVCRYFTMVKPGLGPTIGYACNLKRYAISAIVPNLGRAGQC